MSSVSRSLAQPIPYFYAAPGALPAGESLIFTESTSVPGTGSFASARGALSHIVSLGALLKDMGRTVVSAGRTFRKVQYVSSGFSQTEGILGLDSNYEGIYVELGLPNFFGGDSTYGVGGPMTRYF
jgi:hypothetical protein